MENVILGGGWTAAVGEYTPGPGLPTIWIGELRHNGQPVSESWKQDGCHPGWHYPVSLGKTSGDALDAVRSRAEKLGPMDSDSGPGKAGRGHGSSVGTSGTGSGSRTTVSAGHFT